MKVLKYILFLVLILIIGLAIYVAVQPNTYSFERSRTINAPASLLYTKVNDYKSWPEFSPWFEKEPTANLTYGDKTAGVDASYSCRGDVLGEVSMTTVSTKPNEHINQELNFIKPFEAQSNIEWTFSPKEDGTEVTWKMNGEQDFVSKLFTTLMGSIESETGPDFERGLFKLDSIAQADMKRYSITVDGVTQHSGGFYLYNTTSCKYSNFKEKMAEQFPKVSSYVAKNNITTAGKPFVIYHKFDKANDAVIFSCGIPTSSKITTTSPDVLTGQLETFKAIKTTLKGDYVNLQEAWDKTMAYMKTNNLKGTDGNAIESYIVGPMESQNPADWVTEIFIAIE